MINSDFGDAGSFSSPPSPSPPYPSLTGPSLTGPSLTSSSLSSMSREQSSANRSNNSREFMVSHEPASRPTSQLSGEEHRALIALSLVKGMGPRRIQKLIRFFGSARTAMDVSAGRLNQVPGIGREFARRISDQKADAAVDEQIQMARRVGAYLVAESDSRYPKMLREIHLPPPFLWVRGNIPTSGQWVAVVGTRRPSEYGRQVTRTLVEGLVSAGVIVVSGLAYGIDREAHQATLDARGSTVAVLGSGVDRIYPDRHVPLARRIENSGAIVSEFPLGTKPDASNFPQRNRLISGMCEGTLVIEAFEKGGALLTGRCAHEQNREVFAVPGRITTRAAVGTNRLIRDGAAKLVLSAEDVLEELRPMSPDGSNVDADRAASLETRRTTDSGGDRGKLQPKRPPAGLNSIEHLVIEALGDDDVYVDHLILQTGIDPGVLLSSLLRLELKGLILQLPGKSFRRKR